MTRHRHHRRSRAARCARRTRRSASPCPSATTPAPSCSTISLRAAAIALRSRARRDRAPMPSWPRTPAASARRCCRSGAKRGDRVLLFLDDTPAYPAALFGAMRAGLVPLLINTLTPPDLLQFYLSDSGARIAVCDAAFADRFNAVACQGTQLGTLVVVNGEPPAAPAVLRTIGSPNGFRGPRPCSMRPTRIATTWRSGCTRPAPPAGPRASCICSTTWPTRICSYARHLLQLTRGRHLLLGAEDLLRLRARQLHHLPVRGRRVERAAAGPAQAGRHLRRHRPLPADGVLRPADALHGADQGARSRQRRSFEPAPGRLGRRGAVRRGVQRLEGDLGPRDHGGPRLHRGAAHLSLQHADAEEARAPRASACRATRSS